MRLLGVHLPHPDQGELDDLLARAREADLTYDHVGSTLVAGGSRRSERGGSVEVGAGDGVFERAVAALRGWRAHEGIGALVHPGDAPLQVGSTLLVVLRAGPFAVVAPDRVVAVVDEPDRFGFAYGTLAGHAESGEESFVVRRHDSGVVSMTVRVDARPATLPARVAAPVVNRLQRWALGRYVAAIDAHVAAG
jgi:uncharacterized protein (UPF0548 family)